MTTVRLPLTIALLTSILLSILLIIEPARAQVPAPAPLVESAVVAPLHERPAASLPVPATDRPLLPGIIALYGGTLLAGTLLVQERLSRATR